MIEVYYYLPAEEVENAVDCGLKLSQWFDKEVGVQGEVKKCLVAYLNPKDNLGKYKSSELRCVKLQLDSRYCFVADQFLYALGQSSKEAASLYHASVLPIEKYIFGTYRVPECLVTSTVISGQIEILDKRMDSPILFDNSEELYINNIIETNKEEFSDFNDAMLYSLYYKLVDMGKLSVIEDKESRRAVFYDKNKGKNYTIVIPDFTQY